MGRFLLAVFFTCLLVSPSLALAAEAEKPIDGARLYGTFAPKPGAWSEYVILDKANGKRTVMRLSIVGVEADSYWYEVFSREEGTTNIVKMLVKGDPNNPENIQRLIMQSGINYAREMERSSVLMDPGMASHIFEQRSGIPTNIKLNLQNVKTGEGVVTVPAGTFAVGLHQLVDTSGKVYAKYNFSKEVRPIGIVTSDAGNITVTLVGHGTGANSRINTEPTMITQPPGMADGVPQEMNPGMGPVPGSNIRQLPGMGTGYEPKQ